MSKPVKTSKKQLFVIFIILAVVQVIQAFSAPGMFSAIALIGIFYIAVALGLVWLFAWITDKWDDWRQKE